MTKKKGKYKILDLLLKRNKSFRTELIISLDSTLDSIEKLKKEIEKNSFQYNDLMSIITKMMGNNKIFDPFLWQERMQYAQELKGINKKLNDNLNLLNSKAVDLQKKIDSFSAKEKVIERKMESLQKIIYAERLKVEEHVNSDTYMAYSVRNIG